ncbi:MAG TPA: acyl-CoA dehydrogenase family protein, partial [Gemmataceae bacterium]|nr:acyl-CoA dehydrogenase family protein [Gemmataceae bacterium]
EQVLRAAGEFALDGLAARLREGVAHWQEAVNRAAEMHGELERRLQACDLFLRWIASGQISAFALTEPSAGSDTARVATRARLCSVPVEAEPDGVFRFVPEGGKEARYLLDASRLEFGPEGALYRWSPSAAPAPIRFDEYDYETDDPLRARYYEPGERRIHFTDIGQLREREGRLWFDYWELTGAKMWITNGRMAGVFCLYAKTEEGITGFLVDRHAEGLVVGKDEAKMGQLGSPTNELSLQRVRVPRENVLGLEGRGQVNALETLNVGRAGLAVSAMAQMSSLIEESRAHAKANVGTIPGWIQWRLERMEEDRFTAESLAYEVVGRFEHPQTKSERMESAIAKLLVSELLHEVIELAEDIHGLPGQTQEFLVEKRKRDARILNIYEGTNEVQRFFILKDLAGEVAARWSRTAPATSAGYVGLEALELQSLKGEFHQRLTSALDVFGQQLWQNPNLQANCFLLAEAAAWLKAADSTLGRLAWLERQLADEDAEPSPPMHIGWRAAARCQREVQQRLSRFDEELAHLRRGFYAPEVRAASLLFNRSVEVETKQPPSSHIARPTSILVVLEPTSACVPQPQVADGRLLEAHATLTEADRSALENALRLRDQAPDLVAIQVAAVGPRTYGQALREVLNLGVDRVRLVVTEDDAVCADSAAEALAAVIGKEGAFDLVLGGMTTAADEEGVIARLTAAALAVPTVGEAAQLAVHRTKGTEEVSLARALSAAVVVQPLPAAVLVKPGVALRPFTVQDYLKGLARAVEVEKWPKHVDMRKATYHASAGAEPVPLETKEPHVLAPGVAAALALECIGLGGAATAAVLPFEGVIEDTTHPDLLQDTVMAVVAADDKGRLSPTAAPVLGAARRVASSEAAAPVVLLVVADSEETQRRALAGVFELFPANVVLLAHAHKEMPDFNRSRMLVEGLAASASKPRVVLGELWTEDAFASLSRTGGRAQPATLRVRKVSVEEGQVVVETSRAHGKLRRRQVLSLGSKDTFWLSLAAAADGHAEAMRADEAAPRVLRWSPRFERLYGRGDM